MDTTMYEFDPLGPNDPRSVGGYPLRARIGAGGMGRVYLSFTPGGRAVAVKLIRPEFAEDPEFRERFAREVEIAQRVNGIHIAQLIDSGAGAGAPWLASAYVPGPSLAEVVAGTGPVPAGTVLALAGRIAESLAAVHATGMVHRDLKPGNILLDETGPKVIDFGIVRAVTPTATGRSSHRTFIGSPPFMAPEQIRGQKITQATDVFALGATAYYLATGQSAFQADFADGVLYRVLHDEPDYAACPPEIRELIRACLLKDPAERPGTQRIIEGCKAAGADRAPLLPAGVAEMIEARTRALAVLARSTGTPPASSAGAAAPAGSAASSAETAPELSETADSVDSPQPAQPARAAAAPIPVPAADPLPGSDPAHDRASDSAQASAAASATTTPPPATPGWQAAAATLPPPQRQQLPPTKQQQPPSARRQVVIAAATSAAATAVVAVIVVSLLHLWPSNGAGNPAALGGTGTKQPQQSTQSTPGNDGQGSQSPALAQSSSAADTASNGTSGGTGDESVRWQGQVLLSVNGVDLDTVPVNNASSTNASLYNSSTGFDGSPSTLTAEPIEATSLATWTGSGTPDRAQCLDQVESQGVNNLSVTDGAQICAVSLAQHVALMKIVDVNANGGILAAVTVWAQTAPTTSPTG